MIRSSPRVVLAAALLALAAGAVRADDARPPDTAPAVAHAPAVDGLVSDTRLVARRVAIDLRDAGGGSLPLHLRSTWLVKLGDSTASQANLRLEPAHSARNVVVRLDGAAAELTVEAGADSDARVYRWSMPMTSGVEKRLEVEYDLAWTTTGRSPYELSVACRVGPDTTRGTVREVEITFHPSHATPLPAIAARPVPYAYAPDSLQWRLGNVSTATRFSIAYAPRVATQYPDRYNVPVIVRNLDYPWDHALVSFPETVSGSALDSAWSTADSLRAARAIQDLHDAAREANYVRKMITDGRSDRLLNGIEKLNVGYCRALIDAIDNRDPRKMREALTAVRTRYW